jgi:hypothetical protein
MGRGGQRQPDAVIVSAREVGIVREEEKGKLSIRVISGAVIMGRFIRRIHGFSNRVELDSTLEQHGPFD